MTTRARILALLTTTFVIGLAAPAANAAVTVGEPDVNVDWGIIRGCTGVCNVVQYEDQTGALVASPIDGVIVRWRARADGSGTLALRVFRSVPGTFRLRAISTGPNLTSPVGQTEDSPALEQALQVPVRAGDLIGLRSDGPDLPGRLATGRVLSLSAGLADGAEDDFGDSGLERLLVNADIEPDADGDGFGDETQDGCPTNAAVQGTCPVTPGTPSAPSPPTLGTLTSAANGKSLGVQVACPAGRTACTGKISMRSAKALRVAKGVKKVLHFSERSFNVPSGQTSTVALKLSKGDQKLLKKLKKIRALVSLQPSDAAASTGTGTLKAPKAKKKRR